ncbi:ferrochelatase, partial [Escherichia coli]
HIQVMCPGFAADCLETLEEIAEQNREVFLGAGGKKYEYIPALNATPEHIEMMANLVAAYR